LVEDDDGAIRGPAGAATLAEIMVTVMYDGLRHGER
jgi:hypothetical protein